MHAEVVGLLSEKGRFPTEQALVLAEAIDMAIEKAQLVTIPILDMRLAALTARFDAKFAAMDVRFAAMDAKLERWMVRMVVAMVASQTVLGPIGVNAADTLRRAFSILVR
jgi:hypothetical protein